MIVIVIVNLVVTVITTVPVSLAINTITNWDHHPLATTITLCVVCLHRRYLHKVEMVRLIHDRCRDRDRKCAHELVTGAGMAGHRDRDRTRCHTGNVERQAIARMVGERGNGLVGAGVCRVACVDGIGTIRCLGYGNEALGLTNGQFGAGDDDTRNCIGWKHGMIIILL